MCNLRQCSSTGFSGNCHMMIACELVLCINAIQNFSRDNIAGQKFLHSNVALLSPGACNQCIVSKAD